MGFGVLSETWTFEIQTLQVHSLFLQNTCKNTKNPQKTKTKNKIEISLYKSK